MDAALPFLTWAILDHGPSPEPDARLPEDLLASLFVEHRIVGRALAAARRERPSWFTDVLLAQLEHEQQDIRAAFDGHMQSLRALAETYLTPRSGAVLLKGYGCHLTTGNEAHLRRTLDLDLTAARGEELVDRLKRDGVEEYRNVSPHELMNATLCGADIDWHAHYPVWSVSPGAGTRVLSAIEDVAVDYHFGRLQIGKLTSDHLLEGAIASDRIGSASVFVPDPAAAVLIHCAHGFRNAVSRSSVSLRRKPPLRLAELAEIRDYLDLESFDTTRFLNLAKVTNAWTGILWMGQRLADTLGDERLLRLATAHVPTAAETLADGRPVAPVSIWGGFWGHLDYTAQNHFHRHASTHDIVVRLGGGCFVSRDGAPVRIGSGPAGSACPPDLPGLSTATTRLHGFSGPDTMTPVHCIIQKSSDSLTIDIHVAPTTAHPNQRASVDVNGFAFECNWNRNTGAITHKHSDHPVTPGIDWRETPGGYAVKIVLARGEDPCFQAKTLPILIGAGEFERDHVMHAGTLIPLMLR